MGYSVGIGLTNDCNLACAHCYRPTDRVYTLSLEQIKTICESIPVSAMGMGTGENALNPEFVPIVEYLRDRGIRLSIASNGYSLMTMSDEHLQSFSDVEVSVDFPSREGQDAFRGEGNWDLVHQAMDRCRRLGIEVSILATLMRTNYRLMDGLAALARSQGVNLRVNVYQAVHTDRFRLTYDEFWEGYRRLFASAQVVSCTEPVVRAAMGLDDVQSPCGRTSIRFNPLGQVIPCVYWPTSANSPTVSDMPRLGERVLGVDEFQRARFDPPSASDCRCQGGCASRRALNGALDSHDDYCPWCRGEDLQLDWEPAPAKDLMRGRNVCTTIVT